jgi:hypothetical protein
MIAASSPHPERPEGCAECPVARTR